MTKPAYSYRNDPKVPAFDDAAPIVIFDGLCVLCSTGVQWMLRRDPSGSTRFAAVQDPAPRAIYIHYGLDPDAFDTFMVLERGVPRIKWAGVLAAGRTLPQPWRFLAGLGRLVPRAIGDRFYDLVQRKRIAWFGSRATCLMPEEGQQRRFL